MFLFLVFWESLWSKFICQIVNFLLGSELFHHKIYAEIFANTF
jgi:hypothetical protein